MDPDYEECIETYKILAKRIEEMIENNPHSVVLAVLATALVVLAQSYHPEDKARFLDQISQTWDRNKK